MLEEEGAVIVGLLVGLNVIDANLCVKGEDLDSQVITALTHSLHYLAEKHWNHTYWCMLNPSIFLFSPLVPEIETTLGDFENTSNMIDFCPFKLYNDHKMNKSG